MKSNDVALTDTRQSLPRADLATRQALPDSCRHRVLQRALRIARLLEEQRTFPGITWFADHFSVDARTIRRDFLALEAAGWKVPERPWFLNSRTTSHDVVDE